MACLLLAKSIFSMHFSRGTREITRLDIIAYFDPASSPGSKPQRLSDENDKSCNWKKTFWGSISSKLLTKNSIYKKKTFVFCFRVQLFLKNH